MSSTLFTLAQSSQQSADAAGAIVMGFICVWFAFAIVISLTVVAGMWKVFAKAGQPGWAAIVPFYNIYIMTLITGRPAWWVLMFLVPFVNVVFAILLKIDIAKSFGKGTGFGLGLIFLAPIFYPILGFGSAQYKGPSAPPA